MRNEQEEKIKHKPLSISRFSLKTAAAALPCALGRE